MTVSASFLCLVIVLSSGHPFPEGQASVAPQPQAPWIRSTEDLLANMERHANRVLDPESTHGYAFTLSADENWLALLSQSRPEFEMTLCLYHVPSRLFWQAKATEADPLDHIGRWVPDCFSVDGTRIDYGPFSAAISPSMGSLVLARREDPSHLPEGTCLGLSRPIKNRAGVVVAGLHALDQYEGEQGRIVWSSDGQVLYESCEEGQARQEFLRVTPPGDRLGIRHDRLIALENQLIELELAESGKAPSGVDPEEWKEMWSSAAEIARAARRVDDNSSVELSHLVLAPDRQVLAAQAKLWGPEANAPRTFAVLIPLQRGGLEAFPLACESHDKIIWGRDSRSLYVRGRPFDAASGRTGLLRIELDLNALPAHIEPKEVLREPLDPDRNR